MASFSDVYREHLTPIWRYVRVHVPSDHDAEDVTSEAFTQAMKSWSTFDPSRGSVGGWLTGIARHSLAQWWRKRGREFPTVDGVEPDPASGESGPGPEQAAIARAAAADLRTRLVVLTHREREAVALRFGSEMTSEQIGQAMGISAPAARMLVHRAVTKLREVVPNER